MSLEKTTSTAPAELLESDVIDRVSCRYEINPESLYYKTRKREVSEPRQVVFILLNSLLKMTLKKCTKNFGMNDSVVCTSRRTVRNLYETDKFFRTRFDAILLDLGISGMAKKRLITRINKMDHPKKVKNIIKKIAK